jgi:hypothetical protein
MARNEQALLSAAKVMSSSQVELPNAARSQTEREMAPQGKQAAEEFAFASGCGCSRTGRALCRPCGTRLVNLIQPGTDVPGYRLFRPCRDCLVPVSKALRTPQQIPEQSAVASRKQPAGAKALVLRPFSAGLKSCPDTKYFSKLARNRLTRTLVLQSSIA